MVIASDLDGTLLNNDGELSGHTIEVFRKCKETGHSIVIATGRPYRNALPFYDDLCADGVIANNGTHVEYKREVLQRLFIEPRNAEQLIGKLLDSGALIEVDYGAYGLTNHPGYKKWHNWGSEFTDFVRRDYEKIQKVTVDSEDYKTLLGIDFEALGCRLLKSVKERWQMIVRREADKLEGLKTICNRTGFGLEDVFAFGDDYNDLAMIEGSGTGVAVMNGDAEVKASAAFICGPNDGDGVVKWLEANLLPGK